MNLHLNLHLNLQLNLRSALAIVLLALAPYLLIAQEDVRGTVADANGKQPLRGVTVRLVSMKDSTQIKGAITDQKGSFEIANVPKGAWMLSASFLGFRTENRTVFVRNSTVDVGTVLLTSDTVALRGIEVEADVVAMEMKGDTVQFDARAYKTNAFGSAEDLVKKMPGIQVQGGQVTAQGENVQRVLVDGRRFFGDDAGGTLKNVPADMVDKVQVYDAQSDESRFSGMDDGNTEKTINLVTKKNKRSGQFGKYYGGYGTDERFSGGATHNYFDGPQRITILGLTNNINQQNFSISDILSSMGVGGSMGRMMSGMASRMGASNMLARSGGGGFTDLFVDNQNGITTTHMLGTNVSLELAKDWDLTGSYLFNYADNNNGTILEQDFLNADRVINDSSVSNALQRTHRVNLRMEGKIDSVNTILFTPRLTYQSGSSLQDRLGSTVALQEVINTTNTATSSASDGVTMSGELRYSHRFAQGRVLSVGGDAGWNNGLSDGLLHADNYFVPIDSLVELDQLSLQSTNSVRVNGRLSYTEPFRDKDQLQIDYRPSVTRSYSDRQTTSYDSTTQAFSTIEPALSNTLTNTWTTHNVETEYEANFGDTEIQLGVAYQNSTLNIENTFPTVATINRTYNNILPTFQWRQKFSLASDLRLVYRTSIAPPSATQLQNVLDNTNPIQITAGNPDLNQTYTHSLFMRFRDVNWMAGKTLFGFVSASLVEDFIGNETFITLRDTTIGTTIVGPGAQVTRPVNLSGYVNVRSFMTYGFRVPFIESNLNVNGGVTYARTPGIVNGSKNFANNTTINGGLYLSSNISEDIDFSVSYTGNYNIVANTIQAERDLNYFTQIATARLIWNIGPLACSTDVANSLYSGLGDDFDRVFTIWNAGIGYRFLDNKQAEVRLTVFDILRQNNALNRTINDIFQESTRTTELLQQYFMLTFSYDLRAFAGGAPPTAPGFGPPGMRPRR